MSDEGSLLLAKSLTSELGSFVDGMSDVVDDVVVFVVVVVVVGLLLTPPKALVVPPISGLREAAAMEGGREGDGDVAAPIDVGNVGAVDVGVVG